MKNCHDPCDSRDGVKVSMTTTDYGSQFAPAILKFYADSGWSFDEARFNNSISVSVYFSSMAQTKVEKVAKTEFYQLIGNIGGQLGE